MTHTHDKTSSEVLTKLVVIVIASRRTLPFFPITLNSNRVYHKIGQRPIHAGTRDLGELMQRQDLAHAWGSVLQKTSSRGRHIPGRIRCGMASEGRTNRDTSRKCHQHEATPELENKVSTDTMPQKVLNST